MFNSFFISRSAIDKLITSLQGEVQQLNKDLQLLNQLYQDIRENHVSTLDNIHNIIAAEVEARIQSIEQQRIDRQQSNVPFFEIVTEVDVNDNGKTKFELDWNPAFITELRSKGYTGRNEQELVHKWIKTIATHVEKTIEENHP